MKKVDYNLYSGNFIDDDLIIYAVADVIALKNILNSLYPQQKDIHYVTIGNTTYKIPTDKAYYIGIDENCVLNNGC